MKPETSTSGLKRFALLLGTALLGMTLCSGASASPICEDLFAATQSLQTDALSSIKTERDLVDWIRRHSEEGLARNGIQFEKFRQALDTAARRDPTMAKLVRIFREKKVTFAMDRSSARRTEILKSGEFLNLHQTGTSLGVPDAGKRVVVESELTGIPIEEYSKLSPELKPKSLYLVPEFNSGLKLEPTEYSFDSKTESRTGDTWIFDREAIAPNMFFVVGDSLNRTLIARDMVDDYWTFKPTPGAHLPKDHLIDYILPLSRLETAIPFYYSQVKKENRFRFVNEKDPAYIRLMEEARRNLEGHLQRTAQNIIIDDRRPPEFVHGQGGFFERFPEFDPLEFGFSLPPYGNYVEGLYFGALPVKGRVKALIFRGQPPSDEEVKLLKQAGIQVIDGRNGSN